MTGARAAAAPLLEVEDLHCAYGAIVAVRGLSFKVGEGEIVALLGANGAGKSTSLRAISGMRRAQKGRVTFAGKRIERWDSSRIARLGLALVPEGRRLFTELSVEDNLQMGGFAADGKGVESRIAELRQLFPILQSRRHQRAGTLSGGEQQQLAIARAMVSNPRLLIIDEMSLGLSPLVVADLYRKVREINDAGTAVLLVEQQVGLALRVADRIYMIERGQVMDEGPAKKFADLGTVAGAYLGSTTPGTQGPLAGVATPGVDAEEPGRPVEVVRLPLRRGQARALQQLAKRRGEEVGEVIASAVDQLLAGANPAPAKARSSARRSPRSPARAPRRRPGSPKSP